MTRDELLAWVRKRMAEVLEVDPERIQESTDFAELDADSIDLIEVVNTMEREFDVHIDEQDLYDLENVGQLLDLLQQSVAQRG